MFQITIRSVQNTHKTNHNRLPSEITDPTLHCYTLTTTKTNLRISSQFPKVSIIATPESPLQVLLYF